MNRLSPYAGALLFTAAAVSIRMAFDPWLDGYMPYATLYGAVAASVWIGGIRPAVLSIVLGYLASSYFFVTPRGSVVPPDFREWLAVALYLSSCTIIVGFGEGMRIARRRTEASQEELRRSEAALRDADRRKDEFLATLAHELRNPLAPIRNGLQLLRMAQGDSTSAEKAQCIIERQVEQLVRLVDDLLDISRIKGGKLLLRKQPIELNAVIRNAVEVSRTLIDGGGHEFSLDVPSDPIHVDGDMVRLTQVVANLLNNAAKYSERCGRIRLTLEAQGDAAVITVTDTGIGITSERLQQVFDMLTQVHDSPQQFQGGLGIGLALVSRFVEMHGGTIVAHSDGLRQGSRFTVTLPTIECAEPDIAPATCAETVVDATSLRILVVDDNRDAADTLGKMLRVIGNDIRVAYDGEEAVAVAAEFQPDVIFLDIGLPKIDGYEAARRIRELPSGKTITLVALTGWGQEEDKRRSQAAGFDLHLVKPPNLQALQKVLAGVRAGVG